MFHYQQIIVITTTLFYITYTCVCHEPPSKIKKVLQTSVTANKGEKRF